MGFVKKHDRIILQRAKLYKEAWETPTRQLAKKYGMSDVGLAKICKRMNIPLPPRGYWAKYAHGHKVKKTPLPPMSAGGMEQVMLDKSAQELFEIARSRHSASKLSFKNRQNLSRLKKELSDWETSQRIRVYIEYMRKGRKTNVDNNEFFDWATRYADHLDPAIDFRIEALDA